MPANNLKPRELLKKTMPFVWAKLFLRLGVILIVSILLGIGLWALSNGRATLGVALTVSAIVGFPIISFILNRVVGYFVKAGHIAVLTEMIRTGNMPAEGMVSYGKTIVTNRIGTAATFLVIDKAIDAAVEQLMKHLERATDNLESIKGIKQLMVFVKMASKKALSYVDECCLAWIFCCPLEQSAFKGACDGIVIYFQNWKKILGGAVVTALIYMALQWAIGIILVLVLYLSFNSLDSFWLFGIIAIIVLCAFSVKQAFLDSWAMIKMLHTYLQVAPTTTINQSSYNTLCGISPAFSTLYNLVPQDDLGRTTNSSVVYCGECGSPNPAGMPFCGNCGKKI